MRYFNKIKEYIEQHPKMAAVIFVGILAAIYGIYRYITGSSDDTATVASTSSSDTGYFTPVYSTGSSGSSTSSDTGAITSALATISDNQNAAFDSLMEQQSSAMAAMIAKITENSTTMLQKFTDLNAANQQITQSSQAALLEKFAGITQTISDSNNALLTKVTNLIQTSASSPNAAGVNNINTPSGFTQTQQPTGNNTGGSVITPSGSNNTPSGGVTAASVIASINSGPTITNQSGDKVSATDHVATAGHDVSGVTSSGRAYTVNNYGEYTYLN